MPTISMFYGIVARMYFVPEDGEGITCNAPDSLRSQVIAALCQLQRILGGRIGGLVCTMSGPWPFGRLVVKALADVGNGHWYRA